MHYSKFQSRMDTNTVFWDVSPPSLVVVVVVVNNSDGFLEGP